MFKLEEKLAEEENTDLKRTESGLGDLNGEVKVARKMISILKAKF